MADTRINALSTATSSASDDYVPIDGTTNGTRKLSAFSPTFGGNATVTGTLTANSAITGPTLAPGVNTAAHYFTAYGATTSWPLRLSTIYDSNYVDQYLTLNGTLTGSRATPTFTGAAVGGSFIRSNGENSVLSVGTFVSGAGAAINTVAVFNPTNVTIPQTTASTSTSSGALVVGNGTSGGLGVGGDTYIGGQLLVAGSGGLKLAAAGTTGVIVAVGAGGLSLRDDGNNQLLNLADATGNATFLGTIAVSGTTASTSTSSGALVVSGGVGVAGAGYFGGTVTIASNFSIASTGFYAGGGTPGAGRFLYSATAGTMLCAQTGSSYDLSLASATGTVILGNPTGTSNLEAAGSIKTAAPSGGTAAAWKLGTVATVSPTSPNRTIEVDIGGTIYYIHAKTTNN